MEYLRLIEVLDEQGRSQTWLADQLGISRNAVNALCHNRTQPSLKRLHEIADVLGVDVCALLAKSTYQSAGADDADVLERAADVIRRQQARLTDQPGPTGGKDEKGA